jgi:hypothetical protein
MIFEKVPSKHAEHTRQELLPTLSMQERNWCVHGGRSECVQKINA